MKRGRCTALVQSGEYCKRQCNLNVSQLCWQHQNKAVELGRALWLLTNIQRKRTIWVTTYTYHKCFGVVHTHSGV